jgi:CDP-diacylglycerol--glycerol-3-phosphate 3-phosphatidyltransferase
MVNAITVYRLVAAFLLLYLIIKKQEDIFKWFLAISFFTDAIDGYLARKYKAVSVMGSKLDSIADDLTILMAIIGVFVLEPGFIGHELPWVFVLLVLYFSQLILSLIRYHKLSSFHTYAAKVAAVLQGSFLILLFFLPEWPLWLFRIAAIFTIIDLVEEIILVLLLREWKTDVKGLYWVMRRKGK